MTEANEIFRRYGDGEPRPEGIEPVPCTVKHPDAGGQCGREAVGEVWSLPFCEVHGKEAAVAYEVDEMETVSYGLDKLRDAGECVLHPAVARTLEEVRDPTGHITLDEFEDAIREAYPPSELEGNIDPDTLRFDYGTRDPETGPYDSWCDAHYMILGFMREAHDRDVVALVKELELIRERATVQRLLAHDDLERRYIAPRRKAREEAAAKS